MKGDALHQPRKGVNESSFLAIMEARLGNMQPR